MGARLKKSRTDKMITGVCGGIAEYLGWDPTIVRIIFVITTFSDGAAPFSCILFLRW